MSKSILISVTKNGFVATENPNNGYHSCPDGLLVFNSCRDTYSDSDVLKYLKKFFEDNSDLEEERDKKKRIKALREELAALEEES
jgi:hypothetical protein